MKLAGELLTARVSHPWPQRGEGQWAPPRTQGPGSVLANYWPKNSPSRSLSFYTNSMEGLEHRPVVTFSTLKAIWMAVRLPMCNCFSSSSLSSLPVLLSLLSFTVHSMLFLFSASCFLSLCWCAHSKLMLDHNILSPLLSLMEDNEL